MTAESFSPIHQESNETVKLSIVEAGEELAVRAVPQVVEWGPRHHREDFQRNETPTPDDLTYSA